MKSMTFEYMHGEMRSSRACDFLIYCFPLFFLSFFVVRLSMALNDSNNGIQICVYNNKFIFVSRNYARAIYRKKSDKSPTEKHTRRPTHKYRRDALVSHKHLA